MIALLADSRCAPRFSACAPKKFQSVATVLLVKIVIVKSLPLHREWLIGMQFRDLRSGNIYHLRKIILSVFKTITDDNIYLGTVLLILSMVTEDET